MRPELTAQRRWGPRRDVSRVRGLALEAQLVVGPGLARSRVWTGATEGPASCSRLSLSLGVSLRPQAATASPPAPPLSLCSGGEALSPAPPSSHVGGSAAAAPELTSESARPHGRLRASPTRTLRLASWAPGQGPPACSALDLAQGPSSPWEQPHHLTLANDLSDLSSLARKGLLGAAAGVPADRGPGWRLRCWVTPAVPPLALGTRLTLPAVL